MKPSGTGMRRRLLPVVSWMQVVLACVVLGATDPTPSAAPEGEDRGHFSRRMDRTLPFSTWRLVSLERLTRAAEGGNPEAKLFLALRYQVGRGVPRSPDKARLLILSAAEGGLVMAQYLAGLRYADEEKEPGVFRGSGNYQVAAEWLEKAAEQGHVEAAFELGNLYHFGQLPRDAQEARRWFRKAAEAEHAEAAMELGSQLAYDRETALGERVPSEPKEAIRWFGIAHDRGVASAAVTLADYLILNPNVEGIWPQAWRREEARRWLLKGLADGDEAARARLVLLYNEASALRGVDVEDLTQLANAQPGDPANVLLGRIHERGLAGRERDLKLAAKYYQRMLGMERNLLVEAAEGLARVYADPQFVPEMNRLPFQLEDPALVRSSEGRMAVAELWWSGKGKWVADRSKAIEWLARSAQAGNAAAARRLAACWEQGLGGPADPEEAQRWRRRAEWLESNRNRSPAE